ncbi:MAG: DUF3822 family protein [Ferruginibacter sp.]
MKVAFKIFPGDDENTGKHLLIEAGGESISFLLFSKSPFTVLGLLMYNVDKNLLPVELASEVNEAINNEPLLRQTFNSTTICYNFKESMLIPQHYFNEIEADEMLSLFFGDSSDTIIYCDKIEEQKIVNVYRVSEIIIQVLQEFYADAGHMHSSSLQLKKLPEKSQTLTCIVYHNAIKIILYKENTLQLVQYFPYHAALDVVYHLLNVCALHSIPPQEVTVLLSGMIEEKSNLYNEIYKYFLHIQFDKISVDAAVSENILQYPPHFFSHLISLASCV